MSCSIKCQYAAVGALLLSVLYGAAEASAQTCAPSNLSPNYSDGSPRPYQTLNVEHFRYFFGSNVDGQGPAIPWIAKAAVAEAAGGWNGCNTNGDDFALLSEVSWAERGFPSGESAYNVAIRLHWTESDTCAGWSQQTDRIFLYAAKTVNGISHWCPIALVIDDVQNQRDPQQTGSYWWFMNMMMHEFGHPFGLGDQEYGTGCAMTGDSPQGTTAPWNVPIVKKIGGVSSQECSFADQANSTNSEMYNECLETPAGCTDVSVPPGSYPSGPDGPLRCNEGTGPGGFYGCLGPDVDELPSGPNPVYIEVTKTVSGSEITVICIEI